MNLNMLKGKIHRATVVQAELDYVGALPLIPICLPRQGFWNMKRCDCRYQQRRTL